MRKCCILLYGNVLVHPAVSAKPNGIGDGKIEAGIPVDDDEDVEDHLADPEGIWKVGASLRLVEELPHARKPEKEWRVSCGGEEEVKEGEKEISKWHRVSSHPGHYQGLGITLTGIQYFASI